MIYIWMHASFQMALVNKCFLDVISVDLRINNKKIVRTTMQESFQFQNSEINVLLVVQTGIKRTALQTEFAVIGQLPLI